MRTGKAGVLAYVMVRGRPHVILSSSRRGDRWLLPKDSPKKRVTKSQTGSLEVSEGLGIIDHLSVAKPEDVIRHQKPKDMSLRLYPFRVHSMARPWSAKIDRERRLVSMKNARKPARNSGLRKALLTLSHYIYR